MRTTAIRAANVVEPLQLELKPALGVRPAIFFVTLSEGWSGIPAPDEHLQMEGGSIVKRVISAGLVLSIMLVSAAATQALELQFNLRVPVTCVAQEAARNGDRIDLNLFCNNGRGGELRAHASLDGAPVTVRLDGRNFNLGSGQSKTILSRQTAFRERISVSIASSAAPRDRVALLFQISPR